MDVLLRIFGLRLLLGIVVRLTGWTPEQAFFRLAFGTIGLMALFVAQNAIRFGDVMALLALALGGIVVLGMFLGINRAARAVIQLGERPRAVGANHDRRAPDGHACESPSEY